MLIMNDEGFTPEFKELVNKYVAEEVEKVTTDGKLDYSKAIKYIKESSEKTGVSVSQVLKEIKDERSV